MTQLVEGTLHFEAAADMANDALVAAQTVLRTLSLLGAKYSVCIDLRPELPAELNMPKSLKVGAMVPALGVLSSPAQKYSMSDILHVNGPAPSSNKDAGRTFDTEPILPPREPAAEVVTLNGRYQAPDSAPNPTPAAPAQPDEPLMFVNLSADQLEVLNSGALRFRDLTRDERLNVLTEFGAHLTRRSGSVPSQAMWDKAKPHWMPSGAGASSQPLPGWPTSWNAWQTRFATATATPSGESA